MKKKVVARKGMKSEFSLPFLSVKEGRKQWLQKLQKFRDGGAPSLFPCWAPAWKDRASWKYMWLNFPFWQRLPPELYKKIDSYLWQVVYQCEECGKEYLNKNTECLCL